MQKSNKKYLFIGTTIASIICIITLAILVVTHIVSFLLQEKEHIQDKVTTLFQESVNEDFHNRSKILTGEISTGNLHETNKDSGTFKSSTLEIKTPVLPNLSLDEKMTDFLQSVLAIKKPINVYQLDTIFQRKLKEDNIHIITAICLTDTVNEKNNSCTRWDINSFIPLFMEPYVISSIGITLKAYIQIPTYTLIQHIPVLYWLALLGWLIFATSIGYAWYNLRMQVPEIIKAAETKENTLQNELTKTEEKLEILKQLEKQSNDPDIHIFSPHLLFEKSTKTLKYNGETIKLTRQQQQLLVTFCNAPENICSINDLCNLVWKGCVVEGNTIQQAISRLNITLKPLGLYIQYEFKDSYKLMFIEN